MKRAAAIWAVSGILVLGILLGVLGTHLFYAHKLREPGSFSAVAGRFFAGRLERELALTAEQRDAIYAILEETRHEAGSLREELRPRVAALMEESAERISQVLTPEQRERFAELRREHRGRAEHFFLGPPGPPGPPGRFGRRHGSWRERRMRPGPERPRAPAEALEEAPAESPPDDG